MHLVQVQNPNIFWTLKDWWRKYLSKVGSEEAELNRFVESFRPGSENRLFILLDEAKKIHGFCMLTFDPSYNAIYILQASTDQPREMSRQIKTLADQYGATKVVFFSERSSRAWTRLIGAQEVGHVMEL